MANSLEQFDRLNSYCMQKAKEYIKQEIPHHTIEHQLCKEWESTSDLLDIATDLLDLYYDYLMGNITHNYGQRQMNAIKERYEERYGVIIENKI